MSNLDVQDDYEDPEDEDEDEEEGQEPSDGAAEDEDGGAPESDKDERQETDEEKRERRRQERKEAKERRKRAEAEERAERMQLRQENEEMRRRLARIESAHTQGFESRLNQAISEAEEYIQQAEDAFADAISKGDGERARRADKVRQEARDKLNEFKLHKQQLEAAKQQPKQAMAPAQEYTRRNIQMFRQRHPQYTPQGSDAYSQLVERLDSEVFAAGYRPETGAYWQELERRIKIETDKTRTRPSSPTGGSGAAASPNARKNFTLSPERVKSMKALGYDEGSPEWNEMVKEYQKWDRENRHGTR